MTKRNFSSINEPIFQQKGDKMKGKSQLWDTGWLYTKFLDPNPNEMYNMNRVENKNLASGSERVKWIENNITIYKIVGH